MAIESSSLPVRYPAGIYSRLLLTQAALLAGMHLLLYVALSYLLASEDPALLDSLEIFLGMSWLLTFGLSAVFILRFFQPLKELLYKARRLRKASIHEVEWGEDQRRSLPDEWGELDEALMKIHRSLDKKRQQFQREREELQSIVSSVDDAILAIGHDHRLRYYNSKFAVHFKKKRKEDLSAYHDLFDSPEFYHTMDDALKGRGAKTLHLDLNTASQPRSFRVSVSPLKNAGDGQIYGAVAIFHDETETKLADSVRMDFVANASHELRTPLTSIQGYLDTMKEDLALGKTEDLTRFLDIAIGNVARLRDLVRDLLDISTLESGAEIKKERVNVQEITESVLQQLERLVKTKELEVVRHIGTTSVWGDWRKVEQVLMNLTHNAMKYAPVRSRIQISWGRKGRMDTLIVEDNGPGIPQEHRDRLFERFYRVDKGRSREVGGTGLGLSIVKHIMIRHGGRVELDTSASGTRFVCTFPTES